MRLFIWNNTSFFGSRRGGIYDAVICSEENGVISGHQTAKLLVFGSSFRFLDVRSTNRSFKLMRQCMLEDDPVGLLSKSLLSHIKKTVRSSGAVSCECVKSDEDRRGIEGLSDICQSPTEQVLVWNDELLFKQGGNTRQSVYSRHLVMPT